MISRLTLNKNSHPDILFVFCPMWGVSTPPLGISYLRSYLNQEGYASDILDINIEMFLRTNQKEQDLWGMQSYMFWADSNLFEAKILKLFDAQIESYAEKILERNVKIIGFSVNTGNLLFSLELARRIKEKDGDKILIFGGPHARWFKNDLNYIESYKLAYRGFYRGLVDIFVVGEGELVLGEVLHRLNNNKELHDLPGVITYSDNRYVFCEGETLIEDLDDLPFPDLSWANLDNYTEKEISILMSRGCIRKCKFCNDNFISPKYRCRSAENVFQEIKLRISKNRIENFVFLDLMLNANLRELEGLSDLIIKKGLHIKWSGLAGIRKDMTQDLFFKMKRAGCQGLTYGTESFSDKTLRLMNKPYTYEDIKNTLRQSAKAGISANANVVVGFPGEGDVEFNETIKGIRECSRYLKGIGSLSPCFINLFSDLHFNLDKYGIVFQGSNTYLDWYDNNGNNYELRRARIKRILALASELNLSVGLVNLLDEHARTESNQDKLDDPTKKECQEKIDILLVTLPPWGTENPPIGLGYLDSYIRNKGLQSKVYDFNIYFYNTADSAYKMLWNVENKNYWSNERIFSLVCELFKEQINYAVEKILSYNTNLIGFSVVDPKERITVEVIKRIKEVTPQKKIILGGPACSSEEQRNFFTNSAPGLIDYFVVGEGEETLVEIVQSEIDCEAKFPIKGIAVKEDGRWDYAPRQPIMPLDKISFPDYLSFDLSQYNDGKSILVEWSRGCIGRCSFCKNYRLSGFYRPKSPEIILKELKFLVNDCGIKEFTVCDNLMNGDIRQLNGICERLIETDLKITWSGQIAPRKEMDYDLFLKMKKAGCNRIQIGVESGSEKVLQKMGKIYNAGIAQENIRKAKKAGLETEIFIMIGHPGEDEGEFKKTLDFIRRNRKNIDTIKSVNTLHLIAGTDIYEKGVERFNLKPLPSRDWHYLWETHDRNTYQVRRDRVGAILDLAQDLGIKVKETNISEGKEQEIKELVKPNVGKDRLLDSFKESINNLQCLSEEKKALKPRKRNVFKWALLFFVYIFTFIYVIYFWSYLVLKNKSLLGGRGK